jgi:adenylate cyclase
MSPSRQLAVIMFTDIVGYTRLMGSDEQKALRVLKENRDLHKACIEQFQGRWIKELGDGIMVSFHTVSDAVQAALKIQESCKQLGEYELRIGIHMGEVVSENDDLFGDGVNIASRIQAITDPGSIWVSESVHHNILNKKDFETRFVKKEILKNVKEPVRIYEVTPAKSNKPDQPINTLNTEEGSENSIAVLPLLNMSNDPEQDYFCDGISEEIINALAQLEHLRVIARTSAFAFKGKNMDAREIGKTLDVKTLLEGSVRKSGKHLRIMIQLIRVADGSHLWSGRYDRELEDIFAIQDDIAWNVATSLKGYLTSWEQKVIRRPETLVEAYEYFLKGKQLFHKLFLVEAKEMFEKAIKLDSDYALAYAGLADVHSWLYEWEGSRESDLHLAEEYSLKALTLDPNMAESHVSRAFALTLASKNDEADQEFKEAIRLNSNSFDAYYLYARSCFARGQTEKSAELFLKASEVRREDFQSLLLRALALRILGKNEEKNEALSEGLVKVRKQLKINPTDRRALSMASSSLYEYGEHEEAIQWINRALELYPEDAGVLINAACLFALEGNKEKSLTILEHAFRKGLGNLKWISHDPDFDSLRNEPRFIALVKSGKQQPA